MPTSPYIVNKTAHNAFKETIRNDFNANPDSKWYDGYVAYEWEHLRYALLSLPFPLEGKNVLEFGCNIGASTVVLACLGAKVTAIDVNPSATKATALNVATYGKESQVTTHHFPDTTRLSFDDNLYDIIVANSVLEYVPHHQIDSVLHELKRVLKPQGIIMITGTSSSLALREVHSRRWFVNYIPRFFDHIFKKDFQRGISPFKILKAFKEYRFLERDDYSKNYLQIRKKFGWSGLKCFCIKIVAYMVSPLGLSPSILMPNITATFEKK
jgi:2-polyprenyl-3-methyl-5-hydroxy-6-metoxy-1,4-benzoquinol methylase